MASEKAPGDKHVSIIVPKSKTFDENEHSEDPSSAPLEKKREPAKQKVTETAKLLSTHADNDFSEEDYLSNDDDHASDELENDETLAKIHFAATQRNNLDRTRAREARIVEPVYGKEDVHAVPVTEDISQKDLMWRMMRALSKSEEGEGGSGRAALEKKIRRLHANGKQALSVPLPAPVQDRMKRSKAYDIAKDEVDKKWAGIVQKNRKAKSLVFPLNAPGKETGGNTSIIAGRFKPEGDYEGEIESLLREAGVSNDQDVLKQEDNGAEGMENSARTKEEVLKRRRELAKIRSLMFHYEHKMKRIKKIKSRKYRRVLKKEKEKLAETMGDSDVEDDSRIRRAEQKRVEERMTLRHKNTSKWVRRQLQRKEGSRNPSTKAAIEEQLRIHEELRHRQQTELNNSDSSDEDGDESNGNDHGVNSLRSELKEELRNSKPKGIMGMRFMREAQEKKRKEALALLDELNDEVEEKEEKEALQIGRQTFKGKESKDTSFSKGDLNANERSSTTIEDEKDSSSSVLDLVPPGETVTGENDVSGTKKKDGKKKSVGFGFTTKLDGRLRADVNPWLCGSTHDENQKPGLNVGDSKSRENPDDSALGNAPLKATVTQSSSFRTSKEKAVIAIPKKTKADEIQTQKSAETKRKPSRTVRPTDLDASRLTQPDDELLRMQDISQAFAGVGGAEQSEFDAAKQTEVERNMPTARSLQAEVLPGWGTWDGAGMPKPKRRKTETPFAKAARERLEDARANAASKRSDRKMRHVILNEKRIKQATDLTLSSVPFPFTSREQWEREVDTSMCRETMSATAFMDTVKRRVQVTPGTVIEPIRQPSDKHNARGKQGIIELRKQRSQKRSRARRGLMM